MRIGEEPFGADASARETDARLLHVLAEGLPAMIAYWDRDLHNVMANSSFAEWFGIKPEGMHGLHLRDVLGEALYAAYLPHIEAALAGEIQVFDRTQVDEVGRTRHAQASYLPDVVDGQVRGFFVVVTDVTTRLEAQQAMDESQSLGRLGSWSMVLGTGQMEWSDELYRIFGVDPTDFEPTMDTLFTMAHPDDVDRAQEVGNRAIADRAEYSSELRIRRPDGSVRHVHSRCRPVLDAAGSVVRLTGTLQDVTEAHEAAREMARINAELVQVNQLNADVIGMLGHDVRAPLSVILGYLEALDEDWTTTAEEERRKHVAIVRRAAIRLRSLVDDILSMAALDAGTIGPRLESHELGRLVREGLAEVPGSETIAVRGSGAIQAQCDAFHVRQIVANLASNAQRYGEPPIVVTIAASEANVTVAVADNGPGVPDDFVPHLFERFVGDDRRTTATNSSGFGLYIAARLAQVNRGTLHYAPGADGRGAAFVLTLPLGRADTDAV